MDKIINNYLRLIEVEKSKLYLQWRREHSHRYDFEAYIATPEICPSIHRLYVQVEKYIQRKLARFPGEAFDTNTVTVRQVMAA